MSGYNHAEVQEYWQYVWDREDVYALDDADDPTYVLGMFPYTSGSLHMGHVRNYTITDAYARYRRLRGDDVLHPMGWDAFGLPAENAAYERYTDPESWTRSCIARMRDEMRSLGFGYDWHREITTCDPSYYRWNQWLFNRFHEAGLVEYTVGTVNWCPDCETSLAEAQVDTSDGDRVCWRCGSPVGTRELDQWFLRITKYAEELHRDLEELDGWPDSVKEIQRNWIGRREGVTVTFPVPGFGSVDVFTARLDTVGGATFVAISPEHDLAHAIAEDEPRVASFLEGVDPADRAGDGAGGVATGVTAVHPITDEELPIYVASYVLDDVGTGAVMGVPAHNRRDHEFASVHDIPVTIAVEPGDEADEPPSVPYLEDGVLVAPDAYAGLDSEVARERLNEALDAEPTTIYRLRDWLISRQRYWGTPIPVVHCDDCGPVTVPDEDLPVELPEFVQTTGNPLEAIDSFVETTCPDCGEPARRETDTMDTFFDSSWYFLRFLSPDLATAPFDVELANEWLPVDVYVGGEEHAILHLLYIRFFARALADLGLLDHREPVERLVNHGMVLYEGEKMSASRGNVVAPHEYGAETTRLFLLSAAHPERDFEWTAKDVGAAYDFQQRLYELATSFAEGAGGTGVETREDRRPHDEHLAWAIDGTIASVSADYERFRFHNAITEIQRLVGLLGRYREYDVPHAEVYRRGLLAVARMMAPITPYLGEELWNVLRGGGLVAEATWPTTDSDPERYRRERQLVRSTLADVREIIDVVDIREPDRIEVVVAAPWKHRAYELAREAERDAAIVGRLMDDPSIAEHGEHATEYARDLQERQAGLEPIVPSDRELQLLEEASWLFVDEFDAGITVRRAEGDDDLSRRARPNRPAIHIG